ncbi:PqqD family protein [Croceicoccus gelatinilyticus]|uniref:PqqD family protein n=1 Tax=Croceicoccus gelatinilyticus TaxID=2835536 RepID=UPI001BCF7425|nr:PqqD family protein [Croceicoccus gelatinilyticus]MBS7669492.1 PqqD family protein [Croceicoccus gelatinilyticus]
MISKCEGSFVETEVDGEVVLMNVESGLFYSLEGTGLAIWQAIDGTRDEADIVALLSPRFDESEAQIAEHVSQFVATLAGAGLVKTAVA